MKSMKGSTPSTSGRPETQGQSLATVSSDGVCRRQLSGQRPTQQPTRMCKLSDLKSHPLNAELYGADCPDDLVSSVAGSGVVVPLIVTPENVVISGHRRWHAAKRAGLDEVPVIERTTASENELRLLLLECNTGRRKTIEQLIREYREFKRIEAALAAGRRGSRDRPPAGFARKSWWACSRPCGRTRRRLQRNHL